MVCRVIVYSGLVALYLVVGAGCGSNANPSVSGTNAKTVKQIDVENKGKNIPD